MAVVVSASAIQNIETLYNYIYIYMYTIIVIIQIDAHFVSASHANLLGTINFNEKLMRSLQLIS